MKKIYLLPILALIWGHPAPSAKAEDFEIKNTDFTTLFNYQDRAVQPKRVPWAGSYFAYGNDGIADESSEKPSSAERYDRTFYSGTPLAAEWEKKHHSCQSVPTELKQGCKNWWGHCNAWSAAAIKEDEPREPITSSESTFSIADQKAYLTEIWMNSDALFVGETDKETRTGDWIYDPNSKKALRTLGDGTETAYDAFWDVTPRTLFHVLTNYVGLLGTSVVIDRFTGDEVWNQPLAGYRILPIRKTDKLDPVTRDGLKVYPVRLRMKIYWANDAVSAGHITQGFDIKKTTDDERVQVTWPNPIEYEGRLLRFTLFFSAPVETNEDGTKVLSAGKMVGDGIWYHQEKRVSDADQTHPDFLWLPTTLSRWGSDANPHIEASAVYRMIKSAEVGTRAEQRLLRRELTFAPKAFRARTPRGIARLISLALQREGVQAELADENVTINADGSVIVVFDLDSRVTQQRLTEILSEAGYVPQRIDSK